MKKLIVIAVVFALVAGVAFAETRVSGTIDTRIRLVNADNNDDNDATIGGVGVADGYVQLSGQDDDAKFGGLVRVRANENGGNFHRAFAWWQPIPQVKIFLGHDLDGLFGTDPLTAWGFHQGAESFVERHDWDFWRMVFPGNWDGFGLAFSIYPVQGVDVNLVVPTGLPEWYPGDSGNANRALTFKQLPSSLRLESGIGIPDIGKIYISWIGPRDPFGDKSDDGGIANRKLGQVGVSFLFTMIEGLSVQAGFSAILKNSSVVDNDDIKYPVAIGLAAHYAGGDFGVKFRSAFVLNTASTQTTADSWRYRVHGNNTWDPYISDAKLLTFNVMPWYNLGFMRGFLDIGADIFLPKEGDSDIYFWLNPYVRKDIGPGQIRAGIMVGIDPPAGDGDAAITFQIPVQFVYSF
jgi:hypothetical protein